MNEGSCDRLCPQRHPYCADFINMLATPGLRSLTRSPLKFAVPHVQAGVLVRDAVRRESSTWPIGRVHSREEFICPTPSTYPTGSK